MHTERRDIGSVVIPVAAGVGNAITAMPLVRQLYRGLRRPRITVICFNHGIAGVFDSMEEVAEVKVTGPGARGFFRFVRWTRQRAPDLYLVPFPSNRWQYSLFAALSGAPRVLMHGYPVGRFRAMHGLRGNRLPATPGLHDVVQNLRLLRPLGIEPDETESPRFDVRPGHDAAARAVLQSVGIGGEDDAFVAMQPGSGRTVFGAAKRWPAEKFAELAVRLADASGMKIVVVEGPDEAGVATAVVAAARHASVVALPLRDALGVSAAVLRRSRIYVGNDSALAHLAAAVGRTAVTIFGPTPADTICPFGQRAWAVTLDKPCAPCFSYPFRTPYPAVRCRPPMCIDEIPLAAVLDRALDALRAADGADGGVTARSGRRSVPLA